MSVINPTPLTDRTVAALEAAGFTVEEKAPYGQTVELWCTRNVGDVIDWRGCVLAVSRRGGRLMRASRWRTGEREVSIRGTASQISRSIRAFAQQ